MVSRQQEMLEMLPSFIDHQDVFDGGQKGKERGKQELSKI